MARLRFGRPISLRWNGLLLQGPANTVFEIPDEYYEEFNQDIGPVEPTLVWLDTDEGATLRGRVTVLEGAGATSLSNDAALALGTAASGTGAEASRDDHVHPTTGLALSGHNHDGSYATTGHNHNGTYEPVNTAILKSIVDAKGDLIVGTAADTVARLPGSGTNGYVLTYDSAETTGIKWAIAPGASGGTSVGNATPLALGTASAGDDSTASREDHVHPTTGLALSGHNHDSAYAPLGSEGRADIVYEVCKNSSGTTIPAYSVVYINGADGTNPTIALADADTEATSSKTLGFTETSSNNGDQVTVITQGRLTGVNTSAASTEGVAVWLSSTAGGYVFGTPPAEPAHAVYLGVVTKKNVSTGEIFVKVQNGYELDELHDVSAGSPSNGDVLQYNSTSGMWEKESLATAGIASTSHNHSGTYEVSGAVSTHEGASDPHTQYLTETAASSTYATTGHNHNGVYEVSGAVSTHVAAADPHTQYLTETAASSTYATTGHDHAGVYANSSHSHTKANITDLTTDLAAKAPSASPTFTGTITTPLTTAGYVKTSSGGVLSSSASIAQADVTNLTTDLAAKAPTASPTFTGDVTVNAQGDVRFADSDSSNWVALQAPATVASNVTWTLPSADGTSGQVLSTNGTGALSWATASGGGMTLLASVSASVSSLSVTNIPTTYKDIYIRVTSTPTTTNITIKNISMNTGNLTGIQHGLVRIDNDSTYTSTTIEGVVGTNTTSSATKDFQAGGNTEVENATYGMIYEVTFFDYANASGLNSSTRHFKHSHISPNSSNTPSNASISFGYGRLSLQTSTAAMTSFTVDNAGGTAMTVHVYGVS